ncbi:hypothetical protein RP20_CCG009290 [Aedes albopictus]|nr:hypothetical protein RP20_CCG009290 [Aedes albopictus]
MKNFSPKAPVLLINWVIAIAISLYIPLALAQNCWHIVNVQTNQYLQPRVDDRRHVWLSYNRTDSSYWSLVSLQRGNFFIVNRKTGLRLGLDPNDEFAVLRPYANRKKTGKALSSMNFQFRLHDREGEIVSTTGKYSLYAANCCGGVDGKVKATARCGLPQCQWRFEGYTCQ